MTSHVDGSYKCDTQAREKYAGSLQSVIRQRITNICHAG
jgi:hypothetical protein